MDEVADGGHIAGGIHDRKLRVCEKIDHVQNRLVVEIIGATNEPGQIAGDETHGVAVRLFARVAGELDDAVVGYAAGAGEIKLSAGS